MLGRHDQIGGGTPRQVLNPLREMFELAPYREVRHLTGSRKLIDGNDEFAPCLRLVKKLLPVLARNASRPVTASRSFNRLPTSLGRTT